MKTEITPFVREETKDSRSRSIGYKVHGFWSTDSVRLSQRQGWRTDEWKDPDINWSCGGRDPKEEPDDITAVECFGKAVADAVKVARKWQRDTGKIPTSQKP